MSSNYITYGGDYNDILRKTKLDWFFENERNAMWKIVGIIVVTVLALFVLALFVNMTMYSLSTLGLVEGMGDTLIAKPGTYSIRGIKLHRKLNKLENPNYRHSHHGQDGNIFANNEYEPKGYI